MRCKEPRTQHQLSWMTCPWLRHGPGKGRDTEPQQQRLPLPQQACTQMVTGLVPPQPAAYAAAAAAHIDADAWRDAPEITRYTSQDFSSMQSKTVLIPNYGVQLSI